MLKYQRVTQSTCSFISWPLQTVKLRVVAWIDWIQKSQHWFWEIYSNPKIFDRQRMVSSCFLYIFSTEYQSDEANTLLQHLSVLFEAPVKRLGAMLGYRWHVCPPQCWMLVQHGYQTPTLRNLGKKPETFAWGNPFRDPREACTRTNPQCVRRIAHISHVCKASMGFDLCNQAAKLLEPQLPVTLTRYWQAWNKKQHVPSGKLT